MGDGDSFLGNEGYFQTKSKTDFSEKKSGVVSRIDSNGKYRCSGRLEGAKTKFLEEIPDSYNPLWV